MITVTDRGTVIATVELTAAARGRFVLALPALGRGLHLLRTSFSSGGEQWLDSQSSFPFPVLLY